ncbi:hypothetical protein CpipJ_CPIJ017678 [Culex quinquefasciatus]|uniref:Uncharacterized protein n=1 Tax=Culex quinquefasciatus TaxID=7176 RepID=B0XED9_CULQU|nr:hypothetical protein CpipJ_CPIJ017678 [Culex quinquefasciatus]|eukprot:XP_001868011.1 hypothetical protein CpipJ_CPIJ017678 [Culex quinquefasciatus]
MPAHRSVDPIRPQIIECGVHTERQRKLFFKRGFRSQFFAPESPRNHAQILRPAGHRGTTATK